MVALLGEIRKQMNGAMLDTFRYYGANYGVNYGVAIHTLRDMADRRGVNDSLSRFLYQQQIRELRIIALWIGDCTTVAEADFEFWAAGIVNSEVAEQAAQALLCNIEPIDALLAEWCVDNTLLAYSALLAASRSERCSIEAIASAVERVVANLSDNRLVAQGAVALLASRIKSQKNQVESIVQSLPDNPTTAIIRDEIAWRLEY